MGRLEVPLEILITDPVLMEEKQSRVVWILMHVKIQAALLGSCRPEEIVQFLSDLSLHPGLGLESHHDGDLRVRHLRLLVELVPKIRRQSSLPPDIRHAALPVSHRYR